MDLKEPTIFFSFLFFSLGASLGSFLAESKPPQSTLCLVGGEVGFGGEGWSPLLLAGVQVLRLVVEGENLMV